MERWLFVRQKSVIATDKAPLDSTLQVSRNGCVSPTKVVSYVNVPLNIIVSYVNANSNFERSAFVLFFIDFFDNCHSKKCQNGTFQVNKNFFFAENFSVTKLLKRVTL